MAKPTVLVTGATGHIGSALVERLQQAGASVIAGSPSGRAVAGAPGRAIDFANPATLRQAFEGVDTLFLLFPLVPNKVHLARNAVVAAKAAGVKHIVRSSGAGADPASPMAIGRLQGEIDQLVIDSGLPFTLLRPNSFMQNWVNYYAGMVKGGQVYLSHGQASTAFVDVADIADVAAVVLQNPAAHAGKAYTLTGPQALSVSEVLAAIAKAGGHAAQYVPVNEEAAVASMKQMGMDDWTVGIMSSLNQVIANGWAAGVSGDVQAVTGHAPRDFAAFARDNAAAWR